MKICIFTSQFFPRIGGAEFMVHHLAMEMVKKGHQVSVLAPVHPSSPCLPYSIHPMKNFSHLVARLESEWEKNRRALCWNLTLEKIRFDFDILHAHFAYPYGCMAGLWGRKHRVGTVLTCHGIDVMRIPQWHFGVRPREAEKLTKTFQAIDRVVAVSRNLEKEIKRLDCPPEKLTTIPNGVQKCESQQPTQNKDDREIILAMGRMERVKGFDLLLKVFAIIISRRKNIKLYLVGDGPEFPNLLEIALRMGLRDRVVFKKTVVGEKKRKLINSSTLFICPSRWEGMPLAVLEAMAAGKVVAAFDVGGIGEIITDSKNGILVPPFDSATMAQKIIELLDDPSKRECMETEARQTTLKHSWSRIADQYLELYREVSKGR